MKMNGKLSLLFFSGQSSGSLDQLDDEQQYHGTNGGQDQGAEPARHVQVHAAEENIPEE